MLGSEDIYSSENRLYFQFVIMSYILGDNIHIKQFITIVKVW